MASDLTKSKKSSTAPRHLWHPVSSGASSLLRQSNMKSGAENQPFMKDPATMLPKWLVKSCLKGLKTLLLFSWF